MRRDLDPQELAALEWANELDQRASRQLVRDDVRALMDWGDIDAAGFIFGAQFRVTDLDASRSEKGAEASGLVSVPTSDKRASRVTTPFRVTAERSELMKAIDAFDIDANERRLSNLRRSVGFGARANCTSSHAKATDECLMVTLTYRGTNDEWQPRHIAAFMKNVREWFNRRGLGACRYVWVAELQKRGVIHYHVAVWVPAGVRLPKPDEQGWWPHGMTRIEVARAAVPYLLKYLSKDTSKTFGSFPKGARIYGVGGLDHAARRARRWLGLPAFVQGKSSMYDNWTRAPRLGLRKGGWLSPTGEHFASEFARVNVGGRHALVRVARHAKDIDAAGPFAWLTDRPKVREGWGRVSHAKRGSAP